MFFIIATVFAVAQNVLGVAVASAFGLNPLFGVLAGSVTLTGGPATGLAFAPLFEEAGVPAAGSVAIAAAMAGIVLGGLVGGPVGTYLIEKFRAHPSRSANESGVSTAGAVQVEAVAPSSGDSDEDAFPVLKSAVMILVAMWLGAWISKGFTALGITLPATIGAMLAGAAFRNLDDTTGWFGLSQRTIDTIGVVALSLFLVLALMTLKLWELAALALPLIVNVALQVVLVVLACRWIVFRAMGRDYEAAVMSGGFIGFMLGTTANAMAVMGTLAERYGPAPRAFFVAPMVGAFFIDFTNALIVTGFLNIF